MGEIGAFLKIDRRSFAYRDPHERAHDYHELLIEQPVEELRAQSAPCS